MTLKLDIPKDVEASLLAQAQAAGLTLESYAEQVLREKSRADKAGASAKCRPSGKKSLAELFAGSPLKGLDLKFEGSEDTGRPVKL